MIWWTGLAPWEFEFPFPGSLISTFLDLVAPTPPDDGTKVSLPPLSGRWMVVDTHARAIPTSLLEPLPRSCSHFVGIYRQKLTKSSLNDFWCAAPMPPDDGTKVRLPPRHPQSFSLSSQLVRRMRLAGLFGSMRDSVTHVTHVSLVSREKRASDGSFFPWCVCSSRSDGSKVRVTPRHPQPLFLFQMSRACTYTHTHVTVNALPGS